MCFIKILKIFVGYDKKESVAYHNFCESVIEKSTIPVEFVPLALNTLSSYTEQHKDGSNEFIYSRFLVPYLCNFEGYALYVDSDILCRIDIAEILNEIKNMKEAVKVVQHKYKTKYPIKYLGNKNDDYPKKNWSSVMLFNCNHDDCILLTPEYIQKHDGKHLHRFAWTKNVGRLPKVWNWLALEYKYNKKAKLVHFTIGTPCFKDYYNTDYSVDWYRTFSHTINPLSGIYKSKL